MSKEKDVMEWGKRKTFRDNKSPMPFHTPFMSSLCVRCTCMCMCVVCVHLHQLYERNSNLCALKMASTAGAGAALAKDEDSVLFSRANDFVMAAIIGIWLNIANTFDADFANARSLSVSALLFPSEYLFVFYLIFFCCCFFFRRLLVFYACLCCFLFAGMLVYGSTYKQWHRLFYKFAATVFFSIE